MKELTPEQIQHNWGNLRQLIDAEFTGERLEKLNEMYDYFEERMMFAPASGRNIITMLTPVVMWNTSSMLPRLLYR